MSDDFSLEPAPSQGEIPQRVIDELVGARRIAKNFVEAFADAVIAQADKYKVNKSALKRYVCAIESDKIDEMNSEVADLEKLLGL
jgi:hypothetical protein